MYLRFFLLLISIYLCSKAASAADSDKTFPELIKRARANMVANKDWPLVLQDADAALKLKPDSLDALCVKGHALAALKSDNSGAEMLTIVIDKTKTRDPLWEEAINTRAWAHEAHKQWSAVVHDIDIYLAHYPGSEACWYARAKSLHTLGQEQAALESINTSLKRNPQFLLSYALKARILQSLGQDRQCIEVCNQGLKTDPKYWDFYKIRSISYKALGDYHQQLQDICRGVAE
ncbi:MAG: hypothetical protein K2X27_00970 [Candidatus Obscuribacterales bacterium]|nr:hypothetical protein [Candidatus Obscuribacterales bacterium]